MSVLKKTKLLPLAAIISVILSGCGGGGNDDKEVKPDPIEPENVAPLVKLTDATVEERKEVTLTPEVSDTDGEVVSYEWEKLSGPDEFTLTDADKPELKLTAPEVTADSEIKLRLTVTDDDGATATDEATVKVTSKQLSVSLKGKVTDNDIPDATVTVYINGEPLIVNGEPVTAIANEEGNYTVPISVDDSLESGLITLNATGAEGQEEVALISNIGSVEDAVSSAGSDNTLDNTESSTVNVTNVTTATHALMLDANGGEPINSIDTLNTASHSYEPELLIPISGCIQRVIDYGQDLPEGVEDTLELVSDMSTIRDCIRTAQNDTDAEVPFDEVMSNIVADDDLVFNNIDTDTEGFISTYYFKGPDTDFWGDRLVLDTSTSGTLYSVDYQTPVTITSDETGLTLDYSEAGVNVGELTGSGTTARYIIRKQTTIKRVVNSEFVAQVIVDHKYYESTIENPTSFPADAELKLESALDDRESINAQMVIEGGLKNPTFLQQNTEYSIPVPYVPASATTNLTVDDQYKGFGRSLMGLILDSATEATIKVYDPLGERDNNGDLVPYEVEATYVIEDNHLKLNDIEITPQADGQDPFEVNFDFAFFDDQAPFYANGMMTMTVNGQKTSSPISSYLLERDDSSTWTNENAPGIYNLGWNFDEPLSHFWLELNADKTGKTIIVHDENGNGELDPITDVKERGSRWDIVDGKLIIRRYGNSSGINQGQECSPTGFTPAASDTCQIWHERQLDLYNIVSKEDREDIMFVQHTHKYHNIFSSVGTGNAPAIYYEATDNRKWLKLENPPIEIPSSANAPKK